MKAMLNSIAGAHPTVRAALLGISFAHVASGLVADDLKFETSDFMRKAAYHSPDQIAADIAPDGALGKVNSLGDQTHAGVWYIEEQRYGMDAIIGWNRRP